MTLAQRRADSGLRQSDVARALGIDRFTLVYYEIGVKKPTAEIIKQLSMLYGCTEAEIMVGANR